MKKNGRKQRKNSTRNFKKQKKTATLIYHTKLLKLIWKNNASLNFPTTRMLVQIFHEFCRILNWFCLLCQMLCHKNIKYAKFSCSNLQLPAYNAYRSQQKITDLVVRQLTRSDFVEFCGSKYSDDVIPPRKCHDLE